MNAQGSRRISTALHYALAASVLVGIACPGLFVVLGRHERFLAPLVALLPVLWVIRWRTPGFLAGVLFLWLCAHAWGLSTLGPGLIDNILRAFANVFGGVCALCYLGPIYLLCMAVARMRSAGGGAPTREDYALATEPCQRHPALTMLVALGALVAAAGVLRVCWVLHPRHAQYLAIEAVEATGAQVAPLAPGQPVTRVRGHYGGKRLGDAEMEYIAEFDQLEHLDLRGTNVTDAGLKHLEGLTQLRFVNLQDTRVTEAGVKNLQRALPHCEIHR